MSLGAEADVHQDVLQAFPSACRAIPAGSMKKPFIRAPHTCTACLQIQAEPLNWAPQHRGQLCPGGPGTKAIIRRGGSRALGSAYPADYGIICQAWPLSLPSNLLATATSQRGESSARPSLGSPAGLEFILALAGAFPCWEGAARGGDFVLLPTELWGFC